MNMIDYQYFALDFNTWSKKLEKKDREVCYEYD